jgi:hypothetical protein
MKKLCFLPVLFLALSFVTAQNVTFTFGNNNGLGESQAALDGLASGSVTVSGLTLSAAANSGTFNSTSTLGFGINASPSTTDTTTSFDETDAMTFSFNKPVTFNSIDLNLFGSGESGFFTYTGGTIQITTDPFTFTNVSLAANEVVTFGNNSGSSFSLQSFNVTVIPEPATWMLMGVGLLLGVQRLRRRKV